MALGADGWRLAIALLSLAGCADRPLDLLDAVPDLTIRPQPDLAMPDLAMPDLGMPDLAMPDLAAPDLATVDLARPDLSTAPLCETATVSTLAGNGQRGWVDGTGGPQGTTEFYFPVAVAVDHAGNVYVADLGNSRIRKVAPDGTTTTFAGNGMPGYVDGTGGPDGTTQFGGPGGIACDASGNLYVVDGRIRKIAPDGTTTTLTGNGKSGFVDGTGGPDGTTEFQQPTGIAVDDAGFVYVSDISANRLRKVAPDGSTTTLAGNGIQGWVDGSGGPVGTTEFDGLNGLAVDTAGNVYGVEMFNSRIRKIAPDGTTTTLAGNGKVGFMDGPSGSAEFWYPTGIAVDAIGNLYVAGNGDGRIRKVALNGTTSTLAGDGQSRFADGVGCAAEFTAPSAIAIAGDQLFVADDDPGDRIRQIQLR